MLNLPNSPCRIAGWIAALLVSQAALAKPPPVRMVKDLNRTPGGFSRSINWMEPVNGKLLFSAASFAGGQELWISRGKLKNTRILKDIRPGPEGSFPSSGVMHGEHFLFGADDGVHGYELWRSDGTAEGTALAVDLNPGPEGSGATPLFSHGGLLFLQASASPEGGWDELWATDGTVEGTVDLNPATGGQRRFSQPRDFLAIGDTVHFIAGDAEIWRTDGTFDGTRKIFDDTQRGSSIARLTASGDRLLALMGSPDRVEVLSISADGSNSSSIASVPVGDDAFNLEILTLGDRAIFSFVVFDGSEFFGETWVSNGTLPGSSRLLGRNMESPVSWNGHIYFGTWPEEGAGGLWRSDGTEEGTRLVHAFPAAISNLRTAGGFLYFDAQSEAENWSLWRTDGSAEGLLRVKDISWEFGSFLSAEIGGNLYFNEAKGGDSLLFRTNGKRRGTAQLIRSEKSTRSAFISGNEYLRGISAGGLYYFNAYDDSGGRAKIWRSNGAPKATREVWRPASGEEEASELKGEFRGEAIFSTRGGSPGLWITTGKKDRPLRIAGFQPGEACLMLAASGDECFFTVSGGSGNRLWVTDGTPEGTEPVETGEGEPPVVKDGNLVIHGGIAYFLKDMDSASEAGLWRSDGTAAGTYAVAGFAPVDDHDQVGIFSLVRTGGRLAFFVRSSYEKMRLFTSDGTLAGTVPVSNLGTFELPSISIDAGGTHLFHLAESGEWWRSDGTPAGSYPFINLGNQGVRVPVGRNQVVRNSEVFFAAEHPDAGIELWVTDGSVLGTRMVRDIAPGTRSSSPGDFAEAGGLLYFACDDGIHGAELWRSDGTEAGTVLASDLEPGDWGSYPRALQASGKRLFFTAERQGFGRELHSLVLPVPRRK